MAQFSVTFELAWKALRAVLQLYGVDADTESCRKILGLRIPGWGFCRILRDGFG
jgi:hypothetical protein